MIHLAVANSREQNYTARQVNDHSPMLPLLRETVTTMDVGP